MRRPKSGAFRPSTSRSMKPTNEPHRINITRPESRHRWSHRACRTEGSSGDDSITGDAGDDDLIGGSSTPGTPDGTDAIDGGTGHDVIAGDNASIARTVLTGNVYDRYTPGIMNQVDGFKRG